MASVKLNRKLRTTCFKVNIGYPNLIGYPINKALNCSQIAMFLFKFTLFHSLPCLVWEALDNFTAKRMKNQLMIFKIKYPRYQKFIWNFSSENTSWKLPISASKRRYPFLLWGALANPPEIRIQNPSMVVKMKHPRF